MRQILLSALFTVGLAGAATTDSGPTRVFIDSGELHYDGVLEQDANERLFALYDSLGEKPSRLVITSVGGDVEVGLDLGEWASAKGLDVRVPAYCLSSCANYVFTAGARKIVAHDAIVGFHGGLSSATFKIEGDMKPVYDAMTKEAQSAFLADVKKDFQPTLERETTFFKRIGVRQEITTYGQAARFKRTLEGADVFTFSCEGFARFGVDRIEVTGGAWRPERSGKSLKAVVLDVE
ncbi:hypothetical protein [Massilia sp. X63]|uniref:hypothetical protein n=1 Tax=Massilia sp. X63 TaxID=3237285 RepID=UPI0034DDAB6E